MLGSVVPSGGGQGLVRVDSASASHGVRHQSTAEGALTSGNTRFGKATEGEQRVQIAARLVKDQAGSLDGKGRHGRARGIQFAQGEGMEAVVAVAPQERIAAPPENIESGTARDHDALVRWAGIPQPLD